MEISASREKDGLRKAKEKDVDPGMRRDSRRERRMVRRWERKLRMRESATLAPKARCSQGCAVGNQPHA